MSRSAHLVNIICAAGGAMAVLLLFSEPIQLQSCIGWFLVCLFALYASDFIRTKMKRPHG